MRMHVVVLTLLAFFFLGPRMLFAGWPAEALITEEITDADLNDFALMIHAPDTSCLGDRTFIEVEISYLGSGVKRQVYGNIADELQIVSLTYPGKVPPGEQELRLRWRNLEAQRAKGHAELFPFGLRNGTPRFVYYPEEFTKEEITATSLGAVEDWKRQNRNSETMLDPASVASHELSLSEFVGRTRKATLDVGDYYEIKESGYYKFAVALYLYNEFDGTHPFQVLSEPFEIIFLDCAAGGAPSPQPDPDSFRVGVFPQLEKLHPGQSADLRVAITYSGEAPVVHRTYAFADEFALISLNDPLVPPRFEKGPWSRDQEGKAPLREEGTYNPQAVPGAEPATRVVYMGDDATTSSVVQRLLGGSVEEERQRRALDLQKSQFVHRVREVELRLSDFAILNTPGTYHFILVHYLYPENDFNRPIPVVSAPFAIEVVAGEQGRH